jgi:hypothetical protein
MDVQNIPLNTICIFSEYAEWRLCGKKLSLSTNPGDFKGTTFQKNVMGGYMVTPLPKGVQRKYLKLN